MVSKHVLSVIADLVEALKPFAKYADPSGRTPATSPITQGSFSSRTDLTMADCYHARDVLDRTARAPAEIVADEGWQPIESAPWGARLMVYVPSHGPVVAERADDHWWSYVPGAGSLIDLHEARPTHWRPLPAPPRNVH